MVFAYIFPLITLSLINFLSKLWLTMQMTAPAFHKVFFSLSLFFALFFISSLLSLFYIFILFLSLLPTKGMMALDIGQRSRILFRSLVEEASTILWNGPVGVYEFGKFSGDIS